jgi:hypothetical protein
VAGLLEVLECTISYKPAVGWQRIAGLFSWMGFPYHSFRVTPAGLTPEGTRSNIKYYMMQVQVRQMFAASVASDCIPPFPASLFLLQISRCRKQTCQPNS